MWFLFGLGSSVVFISGSGVGGVFSMEGGGVGVAASSAEKYAKGAVRAFTGEQVVLRIKCD